MPKHLTITAVWNAKIPEDVEGKLEYYSMVSDIVACFRDLANDFGVEFTLTESDRDEATAKSEETGEKS